MTQALTGRLVAAVGVVLGFVAIFTDYVSSNGFSEKYSDDGTVLAYLLVTLILTALLLAAGTMGQPGLDALAAVAGSAACGFFLFAPAAFGFNHFDVVATGGWLGVCTVLIPVGMWYALAAQPRAVGRPSPVTVLPVIVGRVLCIVAIWPEAVDNGPSYWNFADKGRALPALMLVLVIGGAVLGMAAWANTTTRTAVDGILILAAVTFGLFEGLFVGNAFGDFGTLGSGAWIGSAGGLILLLAVAYTWKEVSEGAPRPVEPAPAVAPPAA